MVQVSVFSRAHRAFRDTPRFHFVRNQPELAARYEQLAAADMSLGEPIGVYRNPEGAQPEEIFVAEHGMLAISSGSQQQIKFSEIESTVSPSAADGSSHIVLILRSGIVLDLRVAGTNARYRDVFSFVRFLDRVLEDRQ